MVKAKTKPLNLLIPEDLSEWFTDYAKSLDKTKTEIICTFLQSLKNGEAYSDVENHVGNNVDSIESVVRAYLDEHLQDYIERYLHSRNPTNVETNVESHIDNDIDNNIESYVEPETLPIIEAIENIAAPTVEKPLDSNTLIDAIAAKLNSKDRFSFNEMLAALKIQKDEKGKIGAQNQTQFEYVKQRIFEETGQTWIWEGTPKDGKWIKVNDANIAAPLIENPLPEETLSNEIAATAKPKSTKKKSKKSDANRRFTADQAAKYYSEQSGKPLSASSLRANATKYGFKVWERGSGLYILIDS